MKNQKNLKKIEKRTLFKLRRMISENKNSVQKNIFKHIFVKIK